MSGRATVVYFPELTNPQTLAEEVEDMGFDSEVLASGTSASSETLKLTVTGMTCASCVRKIETTLEKMDGIEKALVALTTNSATITYQRDSIQAEFLDNKILRC